MYILRQNKEIPLFISISNFLTDLEIKQIFQLCEKLKFVDATIGFESKEEKTHNFLTDHKIINSDVGVIKRTRETNLKWIDLNDKSKWLFEKIIDCINDVNSKHFGYVLKFVEGFQFTEYTEKTMGFYSRHKDCGNKFEIANFVDIRKLSFSIQLSDPNDYDGGELKIYNGKKSIYTNKEEFDIAKKDKGTIIFFPSHVFHEVTPVTKGNRYSLVSWIQGPNIL